MIILSSTEREYIFTPDSESIIPTDKIILPTSFLSERRKLVIITHKDPIQQSLILPVGKAFEDGGKMRKVGKNLEEAFAIYKFGELVASALDVADPDMGIGCYDNPKCCVTAFTIRSKRGLYLLGIYDKGNDFSDVDKEVLAENILQYKN